MIRYKYLITRLDYLCPSAVNPEVRNVGLNFYESIALSESGAAAKKDIERVAIRCLQNLHSQMLDILTYHRLQDGVNLPSEFLSSIGLPIPMESVEVNPPSSPVSASGGEFNYDFSALDN